MVRLQGGCRAALPRSLRCVFGVCNACILSRKNWPLYCGTTASNWENLTGVPPTAPVTPPNRPTGMLPRCAAHPLSAGRAERQRDGGRTHRGATGGDQHPRARWWDRSTASAVPGAVVRDHDLSGHHGAASCAREPASGGGKFYLSRSMGLFLGWVALVSSTSGMGGGCVVSLARHV